MEFIKKIVFILCLSISFFIVSCDKADTYNEILGMWKGEGEDLGDIEIFLNVLEFVDEEHVIQYIYTSTWEGQQGRYEFVNHRGWYYSDTITRKYTIKNDKIIIENHITLIKDGDRLRTRTDELKRWN